MAGEPKDTKRNGLDIPVYGPVDGSVTSEDGKTTVTVKKRENNTATISISTKDEKGDTVKLELELGTDGKIKDWDDQWANPLAYYDRARPGGRQTFKDIKASVTGTYGTKDIQKNFSNLELEQIEQDGYQALVKDGNLSQADAGTLGNMALVRARTNEAADKKKEGRLL